MRDLRIKLSRTFKEILSHIIPALHIGPPFSCQLLFALQDRTAFSSDSILPDLPNSAFSSISRQNVTVSLPLLVAVPVLGLDGIWVPAAVLMAAMPTGVNVYLFSARYDAAPSVAARTVLVASTLSVVTISLLLLVFGE